MRKTFLSEKESWPHRTKWVLKRNYFKYVILKGIKTICMTVYFIRGNGLITFLECLILDSRQDVSLFKNSAEFL